MYQSGPSDQERAQARQFDQTRSVGGALGGPVPTPSADSMASAIQDQDAIIDQLTKEALELRDQLSPFLLPEPPRTRGADVEQSRGSQSPLTARTRQATEALKRVGEILYDTRSRLQL